MGPTARHLQPAWSSLDFLVTQVVMLMLDQVEGDQHGLVIGMLNLLLTLIGAPSLMHRSWFISAVHDDGD